MNTPRRKLRKRDQGLPCVLIAAIVVLVCLVLLTCAWLSVMPGPLPPS